MAKEREVIMVKECIHMIEKLGCPFAYYTTGTTVPTIGIKDYSHSYYCGMVEYLDKHRTSAIAFFDSAIAHFNLDGLVEDRRLADGRPEWCPLRQQDIFVALNLSPKPESKPRS